MRIQHICLQQQCSDPTYNTIDTKNVGLFRDRVIVDDPFWGLYLLYLKSYGGRWCAHFLNITEENAIVCLTAKNKVLRDFAAKWIERYAD